jgi:secreted trypsin-like serine protease
MEHVRMGSVRSRFAAHLLAALLLAAASRAQTRIVGGTEVMDGRYPWAAVILACEPESMHSSGLAAACKSICTGSTISPGAVLSAAHCLFNVDARNELLRHAAHT